MSDDDRTIQRTHITPIKIIRPLRAPRKLPPLHVRTLHRIKPRRIRRHRIVIYGIDHQIPYPQLFDVFRNDGRQPVVDADARGGSVVGVAVGPSVGLEFSRSEFGEVELFYVGFLAADVLRRWIVFGGFVNLQKSVWFRNGAMDPMGR